MSDRHVRAYIGLGANVGDAEATLAEAVAALAALPGARLRGVSRLYATDPVGVTDQPDFRNAAVERARMTQTAVVNALNAAAERIEKSTQVLNRTVGNGIAIG